jgi:hypothetical protein
VVQEWCKSPIQLASGSFLQEFYLRRHGQQSFYVLPDWLYPPALADCSSQVGQVVEGVIEVQQKPFAMVNVNGLTLKLSVSCMPDNSRPDTKSAVKVRSSST